MELMAGRAAKCMLLDGEPEAPSDDLRQARELARLICSSDEAIETFIAQCDVAARADWHKRELSAHSFLTEKDHAGDAPLPHTAHDPVARLRESRIVELADVTN